MNEVEFLNETLGARWFIISFDIFRYVSLILLIGFSVFSIVKKVKYRKQKCRNDSVSVPEVENE